MNETPRFAGLSEPELAELPLDELAMQVLKSFAATKEWNTDSFLLSAAIVRLNVATKRIFREAIDWLINYGLLSHADPDQSAPHATFITRAGHEALASGLVRTLAQRRLSLDLHPNLARIRSQFLLGEYELAAFAAMREVEIHVRELTGRDASEIGVALMRASWNPTTGALADPQLDPGERVALMELFAGAIGTFKNPPSHRQVDYSDPTEAAEVVLLADLLLRILDRTARQRDRKVNA